MVIILAGQRSFRPTISYVFEGWEIETREWCDALEYRHGRLINQRRFHGECCEELAHNWALSLFRFDEKPVINGVFWTLST